MGSDKRTQAQALPTPTIRSRPEVTKQSNKSENGQGGRGETKRHTQSEQVTVSSLTPMRPVMFML